MKDRHPAPIPTMKEKAMKNFFLPKLHLVEQDSNFTNGVELYSTPEGI
jgi:hypothetical protein